MRKQGSGRKVAPGRRMTVREKLELIKQIRQRNEQRRAEFKRRK